MAAERLVHKKRISSTHIRELDVYYDKGGMNYWDYSQKPKGIFFASTVFEQEEGSAWKTLKIGIGSKTPGVGYVLRGPARQLPPEGAARGPRTGGGPRRGDPRALRQG